MKVLLFNGSPHPNGCTNAALTQVAQTLQTYGIKTQIIQMGNRPIQDCIACGGCVGKDRCVFNNDGLNDWLAAAATADAFVFGSPVYYAHPTGRILSAMDRMFYAGAKFFQHKPAAVVTTARRAGTTATLDAMMKHLTFCQMPVVTSTYWPQAFGNIGDTNTALDQEGLETMQNLAHNMAWLMQCIQAGQQQNIVPPTTKKTVRTNFVR